MTRLKPTLCILAALSLSACDLFPGGCQEFPEPDGEEGSTGTGTGSSEPPLPPIEWAPCSNARLKGLQCARIRVPLDHDNPKGPTVELALSRLQHTSDDFRGVIMGNPGGPGGSGLRAPYKAYRLPGELAAHYDWVGLDPRGVGESLPRIDCAGGDDSMLGYPSVPQNDEQVEAWKAYTKSMADRCAASPNRELLDHLQSTDMAKDIEYIRRSLDVPKFIYWGTSYGSFVGQLYTTLFPERVEKMVISGVMDPATSWYDLNLDQQRAFEDSGNTFFAWLGQHDEVYHLGDCAQKVKERIYGKLEELRALEPVEGLHPARVLTETLVTASYGVWAWDMLGHGLDQWFNEGEMQQLVDFTRPKNPNLNSIYLSVMCTETQWPQWDKVLADARRSHETGPMISWHNTWFNSACVNWPAPFRPQASANGVGITVPILMINETYDGPTPMKGALRARNRFPSAVLVERVGGSTHGGELDKSPCISGIIYNFLQHSELPPRKEGPGPDATCEPVATPEPRTAKEADGSAYMPLTHRFEQLAHPKL